MANHYEVLGISENASKEEIKRAYRQLCLQWHPDKNSTKEAETKFKQISESYHQLIDPELRSRYDEKLKKEKAVRAKQSEQYFKGNNTRRKDRKDKKHKVRRHHRSRYSETKCSRHSGTNYDPHAYRARNTNQNSYKTRHYNQRTQRNHILGHQRNHSSAYANWDPFAHNSAMFNDIFRDPFEIIAEERYRMYEILRDQFGVRPQTHRRVKTGVGFNGLRTHLRENTRNIDEHIGFQPEHNTFFPGFQDYFTDQNQDQNHDQNQNAKNNEEEDTDNNDMFHYVFEEVFDDEDDDFNN